MTTRVPADGGVHDQSRPGPEDDTSADTAASPPPRRTGAPVTFVQWADGRACAWTAMEVDCTGVPGARRARCLLFTRETCIRRVWDYPANWRTLDDAALATLSWGR